MFWALEALPQAHTSEPTQDEPHRAAQSPPGTFPRWPHPQCLQKLLQVQGPAAIAVPAPAHTFRLCLVQHQPQLCKAPSELPGIQGPAPVPVQATEKPGAGDVRFSSNPWGWRLGGVRKTPSPGQALDA